MLQQRAALEGVSLLPFAPQPGEIAATEHWCSSGFANTDLDLQLKRRGIQRLVVKGIIAHTCLEATVRFDAELGYDVTVVRDATAKYSDREMHTALEVNIPRYASAIVTTNEIIGSISSAWEAISSVGNRGGPRSAS